MLYLVVTYIDYVLIYMVTRIYMNGKFWILIDCNFAHQLVIRRYSDARTERYIHSLQKLGLL